MVVDDQPAKLLSYEVVLKDIGATLIKAASACEAFECLLKGDVALILIDVCMPGIDGFELASLIREHPRIQRIAIIFVSALMHADSHRLRGNALGALAQPAGARQLRFGGLLTLNRAPNGVARVELCLPRALHSLRLAIPSIIAPVSACANLLVNQAKCSARALQRMVA